LTYAITYHCKRTNEQHTIEWVAPKGWGQDAICDAFHAQYSTAEVLFIKAKS
jgi:hypothetical protein